MNSRAYGTTVGWAAELAVVLLVAGCDRSALPGRGPELTLPDGTRLRVERVGLAKDCHYQHWPGPPWARPFSRYVPGRVARWLGWGGGGGVSAGSAGGTNLFLVTVTTAGRRGTRAGSDATRLHVRDDSGSDLLILPGGTLGTGADIVRIWRLPMLPTRSRTLEFEFDCETTGGTRVRAPAFRLPNPGFQPREGSTVADVLPARRRDSDLEVALVSATNRVAAGRDLLTGRHGLLLRFETWQGGQRVIHWRPENLEIIDPLLGTNALWGEALPGGLGSAGWRTMMPLWPAADPCRLRLELSRATEFDAADLWSTEVIVLEGEAQGGGGFPAVERDGISVVLHSLTPPRGTVPAPFTGHWTAWRDESEVWTLWVQLSPEVPGWRLTLVRAVDDRGREAKVQSGGWSGVQYAYGLRPPDDAKALRFTFALHRSRFVEFVVDPRAISDVRLGH